MNHDWIVELEPGAWIAETSCGDPPRTLIRDNAKKYHWLTDANMAIAHARTYRPFPVAMAVKIESEQP